MSEHSYRGGRNDGSRKYQSINLAQHFSSKRDYKTAAKSTTGRGLQSLGKVSASSRRLPRPAVCSSLKKENAGNDPNVALVPGSGGWASKKDNSASQVEQLDGERGWKNVSDLSNINKDSAFSQNFPSLGEEEKTTEKLELRPQTGKWGEKKPAKGPSSINGSQQQSEVNGPLSSQQQHQSHHHPSMVPQIPPQTFGVVQMPMYGMVPVPGHVYPGIYRPVYPGGTAPGTQMFGPNNPGVAMPYVYAAPSAIGKTPPPNKKDDSDKDDKEINGPSYWGDDDTPMTKPTKVLQKLPSTEVLHPGYISPYTQPYPGKGHRSEAPQHPPRTDPEGKAPDAATPTAKGKLTYHGRTSSHSSLSEPVEDDPSHDLSHDLEEKLDLGGRGGGGGGGKMGRVISRTIVKKELKAFPREEEIEVGGGTTPKAILQKPPTDHETDHETGTWEEGEEEKRCSVWEERKRQQESKPNAWNITRDVAPVAPPTTTNDRFFEDDYDPREEDAKRAAMDEGHVNMEDKPTRTPGGSGGSRKGSHDRGSPPKYHDRGGHERGGGGHERGNSGHERGGSGGRDRNNRRVVDSSHRKAIEETSSFINSITKPKVQSRQPSQSKPVEILQKPLTSEQPRNIPPNDVPVAPASKSGSGNYWQDKQAERERKLEEEERDRRERERTEAQKARQDQYQDYRTPEQYGTRSEGRRRSDDDRRNHGSRRRTYDEGYDYDPDVKYDRRGRYEKGMRSYRDERARSDYRDSRTYRKNDYREYESQSQPRARSDYRRYQGYYDERYYRDYDRAPKREKERGKKAPKAHDADGTRSGDVEGTPPKSSPVREEYDEGQERPPREQGKEGEQYPGERGKSRSDRPPRESRDRYDRRDRYYDRHEFSYRRDPRDRRPRESQKSRDHNNRGGEEGKAAPGGEDTGGGEGPVKQRDRRQKPMSRAKERVERYKAEQRERKNRGEKSSRKHPQEEEEYYYSAEEQQQARIPERPPPKQQSNPNKRKPSDPTAASRSSEGPKNEKPPRRTKKVPSIRYYSANPADRKANHSAPPASSGEKQRERNVTKDKRDLSEQFSKSSKDPKAKKEPSKKSDQAKANKPAESAQKAKEKEELKKKKVEKTRLEMDRLKKMTQAGVDLLSIGIYAVDGKEIDEHDIMDDTDGFVEVVRKKSKKDPEAEKPAIEKKPTGASSKSKKTKKSDKNKKSGVSPPTVTGNRVDPAEPATPAGAGKSSKAAATAAGSLPPTTPLKMWNSGPDHANLGINIWSNNSKQNAWDKPLSFAADKQDPRDIITPLSGESSSLFSSEADLAKKTKEKDKFWKGDVKGPRFKNKSYSKGEKKKVIDQFPPSDEETVKVESDTLAGLNLPVNSSGAPSIPPGVEDLFGLRSDGEDEKPTLSSLVLDSKIPSPIGPAGKITVPSPAATTPIGGLPPRPSLDDKITLDATLEVVQKSPDKSPDRSAETSTQTTPPVKAQDMDKSQPTPAPPQAPPSVPTVPPTVEVVTSPRQLDPVVDQLITSTGGLTLSDRLQSIAPAPAIPPPSHYQPSDRVQWMQGSPLIQSLGTNAPFANEPSMTPPISHQQAPLLGHFIHSDVTSHHPRMNSPGTSLMGSHTISSPLSTIGGGALGGHRNVTNDILKSYISPVSPTNKIYPTAGTMYNNQTPTVQPYISGPFSSTASPSMSPVPSQLFAPFPKSNSPKLQNLYGNNPSNMFENMDPTFMGPHNMVNKPSQLNLTSRQLFYQNVVPPTDMFYKMSKQDSILLQSDMSKHVDAKPFNPGTGMPISTPGPFTPALIPPGANIPRPNTGFTDLLPQAAFPMPQHPQAMLPSHVVPGSSALPPRSEHKLDDSLLGLVRPPLNNDMTALNGILRHTGMQNNQNLFPPQHHVPHSTRHDAMGMPQYPNNFLRPQRTTPRVKLARDGRLHRVPEVRNNKFSSFMPPAVQQHMQQQSLAQISQYSASISDATAAAGRLKETLPENMKPAGAAAASPSGKGAPGMSPAKPTPALPAPQHSPVVPTESGKPEVEETKIVDEKPVKNPPVGESSVPAAQPLGNMSRDVSREEKESNGVNPSDAPKAGPSSSATGQTTPPDRKKTEKRKYAEFRKSYRRGGGSGSWNYYDNYYEDRPYHHPPPPPPPPNYRNGGGGGGGGSGSGSGMYPRGRYPPPHMYRGYPPPPPSHHHHHRDYRHPPPSLRPPRHRY